MSRYLLAHDLGTSGNKATLYTTSGELVKSIVSSYDTNYFNGNWAEQNPHDWWEAVCLSTRELLIGINNKDIAAVSFSGQMQGCVCVDKERNPLRPAIIWADQRATKETDQLTQKIGEKEFYKITGHRASPAYSIEKLMWVKHNEPEIYEKTHKMLLCKDYIVLRLTDEFMTDYSDASGTNAFDLNKMDWSKEIIEAGQIDINKFPRLVTSTHIVGGVTHEAAGQTGLWPGTPVVMGGGDGVCATVGASCVNVGDAYSCVGSSAWVGATTKEPIYDDQMRTFNFAHMVPGLIMPCGTMQAGGASYSWLKNEIAKYESQDAIKQGISPYILINEAIERSSVGSKGLIYLPYLLGERSPRWNPDAKGAFIGLKMEHERGDIFRSVLEGVTLNLNIILSIFKEHIDIKEMIVIGGGAKGEVWRQIMADIYGMPILKPNYIEEATSMGAAIAAGVGVGVFQDFEVARTFFKIEDTINPIKTNQAVYEKIEPIFEECYDSLVGVYGKLARL